MSVNIKAQKLGVGFVPQSDLVTANASNQFWNISKLNQDFANAQPVYESDAEDIGKGSEFATQLFPLNKEFSVSVQKRLSSQFAAWAFVFGFSPLSSTVATSGANYLYTCVPMDVCDGLDLSPFSVVEQLGAGCPEGNYLDRMGVGCVLNSWTIAFQSGPGRNNTTINCELVGTGKTVEPSNITLPATLQETTLSGSSAMVTINGIDYVANKSLLSLEANFANNVRLDSGFFIGSGVDNGFALRGRMERGDRAYGLTFTARLEAGAPEYAKLMAGSQGTAVVQLVGASGSSMKLTYHKVQYKTTTFQNDSGIATVNVTVEPLEHETNGVIKAEITTNAAGIGGLS